MPQCWLIFTLCAVAVLAPAADDVGEFSIRPAIPLGTEALAALRRVAIDEPRAAPLVAQTIAAAEPFLNSEPQPLAVIHYEGLVNTDPRRIAAVEKLRTMDEVAALLQRWQVREDPVAAATMLRHVAAWADTYHVTGNDVNENKLVPLLVAWHALRAQAPADMQAPVMAWITDMGKRHAHEVAASRHFTNRYTKHVRLAMYCGLACERPEWVALGREGIERFVSASLRADGTSLDLERRDTLTYHCSALGPALEMAMLMGDEGRALYTWVAPEGGSIKKSVDYVIPFATGEQTHAEWVHTTVDLDRRRAAAGLEKYRAGRLFEPIQAAGLLEAASAFEPSLIPLWGTVTNTAEPQFGSWKMLVASALQAAEAAPQP